MYRELRNLVKDGLVKASEPVESLRWATSYRITDEGVRAYNEWRLEVEPREYLQDPILLRCALDMMNHGKFDEVLLHAGRMEYKKLMDKTFINTDDRFAPLVRSHYKKLSDWLEHERTLITRVSA